MSTKISEETKDKLIALKFALQGEVTKRFGQCRVDIADGSGVSKCSNWLMVFTVHTPSGNQQFEVYENCLGEIHWDNFNPNFNESVQSKVIN